MKLRKVLGKKNPYLFRAKYILTAQDIIKSLTDAFISSQQETIFGDWLEVGEIKKPTFGMNEYLGKCNSCKGPIITKSHLLMLSGQAIRILRTLKG